MQRTGSLAAVPPPLPSQKFTVTVTLKNSTSKSNSGFLYNVDRSNLPMEPPLARAALGISLQHAGRQQKKSDSKRGQRQLRVVPSNIQLGLLVRISERFLLLMGRLAKQTRLCSTAVWPLWWLRFWLHFSSSLSTTTQPLLFLPVGRKGMGMAKVVSLEWFLTNALLLDRVYCWTEINARKLLLSLQSSLALWYCNSLLGKWNLTTPCSPESERPEVAEGGELLPLPWSWESSRDLVAGSER